MPITYQIAVDTGDDGTFSGDLTADTVAVTWRIGMDAPFASVAQPGVAQVTVQNADRRYTPTSPACLLERGFTLRIQSDDGDSVRTHFIGTVTAITPEAGEHGTRRAVITAHDALHALTENRVRFHAQVDVTADTVIAAVLDRVPLRLRYLAGAFIVGVSGRCALGVSTHLPPAAAFVPRVLQPGVSRFAYVGDTWDDGVQAMAAIHEAAAAERGRFYSDADGRLVLLNRHALLMASAPVAAFVNNMDGVRVTYGVDGVSRVGVTLSPRTIGAANAVLWSLGQAQRIVAGMTRQFSARFRGDAGERLGALAVRQPRPYADYRANTQADGRGTDLTRWVTLRVLGNDGATAQLEVANSGAQDAYLLAGAVVRGQPLVMAHPMTVEQRSATSQTWYGARDVMLDLPGLTRIEEADSIARYELARRSVPTLHANKLVLVSSTHRPQMIARRLFERITVTEHQSGHSGDYWIVGAAHHITHAGARHRTEWTLEPVNPAGFAVVGAAVVGDAMRVGY